PGSALFPYTTLFRSLAISEGASGSVFLLSAPDFKVERELSVQQGESRIPYVAYLFWLEDNTSLLGLAYDGTSYLWNTTTGDLLRSEEHTSELQSREN